jgi:hypothetical protein
VANAGSDSRTSDVVPRAPSDEITTVPAFLSTVPAYDIQPKAEHPVKTGDCGAPPKRPDFSLIHPMVLHNPRRNTRDMGCAFRAVA